MREAVPQTLRGEAIAVEIVRPAIRLVETKRLRFYFLNFAKIRASRFLEDSQM